jgi:hypothetical protein
MTVFRPRRPSAALVLSAIALIVSLGGTAYASGLVGRNSVGTKQLRNGAVTSKKIQNKAVTTRKIRNGAVTAAKINTRGLKVPNALHADSATNAGIAFNAGHATTANIAISAGSLTGVNVIRGALSTSAAKRQSFGEADCPAGQFPVGGGVWTDSAETTTTQSVNSSWPTRQNPSDPEPDAWGAWVNNTGNSAQAFYVYAVCASGSVSSTYAADFARHR